ncbi:hypothetical protein [Neoasaia chiangmaiensis]|uniref:Uncharacterized protein n=1 Tax=Neoasaia chiangmaiensis TaxID=320497 RepID=A0A1U9KR20_9PROT|nr:hypothetical protein [Neoasaia chiangmaiensis]AQS88172.1 hypothetical protein A0U93_09730 [Neoasaia chiangmaiensis]
MSESSNPRQPSRKLTEHEAVIIINRIKGREFQNRIAADFDVNPGRISDIKMGRLYPHLPRPPHWTWPKKTD